MKYLKITDGYKKLNSKDNYGNFNIIDYTRTIRRARNAGCCEDACYADTGVCIFFIPLERWGGKNLKEEEISQIEANLKDWIRFGRKILFRAKYKGIHEPRQYIKENYKEDHSYNVLYKEKDTRTFVIEWDTLDVLSEKHNLGTLSFFRYFYSSISNLIYRKSIEIKTAYPEMSEKLCFWISHVMNTGSYDSYYGLYYKPSQTYMYSIPSIKELYTRYNDFNELNDVWSNELSKHIKSKKLTQEEYEKVKNTTVSKDVWNTLCSVGVNNVKCIEVGKNSITIDEFLQGLRSAESNGTLYSFIEPFLPALYE